MPNLERNGITDVSTSSSTIEEIADIMFSFQASRDDDFIAVELWRKALDSITASITLLAKNARAEFIDLLLKSYDSRSSKASVEFLTFFGSFICVANDDICLREFKFCINSLQAILAIWGSREAENGVSVKGEKA